MAATNSVDPPPFGPARRRLPTSAAFLGLAVLGVLWGGILLHLDLRERDAVAQAHRDVANLSIAVREEIERTLAGVDQVLRFIAADHDADPARFDFAGWLRRSVSLRDVILQLGIGDANGIFAASSLKLPETPISLTHREYFQVHAQRTDAETFVARPVFTSLARTWGFQLSRRLEHPDGGFAGVVFATVDANRIAARFAALDVGPGGSVALLGRDGFLRARAPFVRGMFDHGLRETAAGQTLFSRLDTNNEGTWRVESTVDRTDRIYGFRNVRSLPLAVVVGKSTTDVLAPVAVERQRVLALGGAATLAIAGLFALVLRELEHRRRAQQRLLQAHRDLAATEQRARAAETTARKANQDLLAAEKVAQFGFWRVEVAGPRLTWSPEIFRIYGRDPASGAPSVQEAIDAYHPGDRAMVQHSVAEAMRLGRAFEFRARILRPSGEERVVISRGRVERAASGAVAAVFGTIMDVTELSRTSEPFGAAGERRRPMASPTDPTWEAGQRDRPEDDSRAA